MLGCTAFSSWELAGYASFKAAWCGIGLRRDRPAWSSITLSQRSSAELAWLQAPGTGCTNENATGWLVPWARCAWAPWRQSGKIGLGIDTVFLRGDPLLVCLDRGYTLAWRLRGDTRWLGLRGPVCLDRAWFQCDFIWLGLQCDFIWRETLHRCPARPSLLGDPPAHGTVPFRCRRFRRVERSHREGRLWRLGGVL